jgi:hypothetical protein
LARLNDRLARVPSLDERHSWTTFRQISVFPFKGARCSLPHWLFDLPILLIILDDNGPPIHANSPFAFDQAVHCARSQDAGEQTESERSEWRELYIWRHNADGGDEEKGVESIVVHRDECGVFPDAPPRAKMEEAIAKAMKKLSE